MHAHVERVINGDPIVLCPEYAYAEPLGAIWEPQLYARFKAALRPGMTVLDVGASFGLYSLAAARRVAPSGRIHAFEPARRSAAALRQHLEWNGASELVEVVEAAVAARTGSAVFWEQETSFVASLLERSARQDEWRFATPVEPRRVRTVALDDFCRTRGLEPDAVKVDVEGGEADVLRGARELLHRGGWLLFLELHPGEAGAQALGELDAAGWAWEHVGSERGVSHYVCSAPRDR
jgi:FkbM family methyltransferase